MTATPKTKAMDKGTKQLLFWGAIGAAGVAFWYFFFGPGATASSASSPGSAALPAAQMPWTLPANAGEVQTIQDWISSFPAANALNKSQWQNYMEQRASQQDIDVMNTLITQYWDQHVTPPASLDNYFTSLGAAVQQMQ